MRFRIRGRYAFHNCDALESVELPKSLQSVGDYVFKSCSLLASVTFPVDSELTSLYVSTLDRSALAVAAVSARVAFVGECVSLDPLSNSAQRDHT